MGQRFRTGVRLVGASWQVLRTDRQLIVLPLAAFGATALAAVPLAFGLQGVTWDRQPSTAQWLGLAAFYFVANLVTIYCNAALIAAATVRLDGGVPTLRDGLRAANRRLGRIVAWALVGTGVNLAFEQIESRLGPVGRGITWVLGFLWDSATFLVVPVLVFEEAANPFAAMKRSVRLFRRQWGEQLVGDGAIGLVAGLVAVPLLVVAAVMAATVSVIAGLVFGALVLLATIAVSSAMSAIFTAALYRHATTGQESGPFTVTLMRQPFSERRRKSRFAAE